MSPRVDGMPEGHPEQLPFKLATLTLFATLDDDAQRFDLTTPELKIHVGCPEGQQRVVSQLVLHAMKGVIDQEAGPCPCGQCTPEGGDAS